MERKEFSAKSVELAVVNGLKELGLTADEAEIEVIEEGGFLKKAKVLITKKKNEGELALQFIEELIDKMNITCVCSLDIDEKRCLIDLKTTDNATLIGYRGDVLDAIQYLASLVSNSEKEGFRRIVVDCEGYREKREIALNKLSLNLAKKATKTGRVVELEAMNPYERRIIHSALQDDKFVYTKSKGEDPDRRVIIIPKNKRSGGNGTGFNRSGGNYENRNKGEGYDRKPREGRFSDRDNGRSSQGGTRPPAKKSGSFGFGTYLGKSESAPEENND